MTNPTNKWRTVDMCGRKVDVLDAEYWCNFYNKLCEDCGQPAHQVVCEIADDGTPKPDEAFWFYCGVCQVGG